MRIDSLTSLRFFAAVAVFVHHMDFLSRSPSPDLQRYFSWGFEGFAGVQFFFILSGFVISYSFSLRQSQGGFAFSDFLFFRAARLFPLHWVTMIAAILLYQVFTYGNATVLHFLAHIFLFQSAVADTGFYFGFNGVSWSISTEMFFYLGFCLVVARGSRTLFALWLGLLAIIFANTLIADMSNIFTTWLLYINPVFRFIDFLTGMLLYRAFAARPLSMSYAAATRAELGAIAVVVLALVFAIVRQVGIQWRWDLYYILPMGLMVYVFAHQAGAVSRLLAWRPLVLLGDASFALYMIHQLIINAGLRFFTPETLVSRQTAAAICLAILVVGIGLSVLVYLQFEKPLNLWLRRLWMERRSRRTAPA